MLVLVVYRWVNLPCDMLCLLFHFTAFIPERGQVRTPFVQQKQSLWRHFLCLQATTRSVVFLLYIAARRQFEVLVRGNEAELI